jgi:hypothetical protein
VFCDFNHVFTFQITTFLNEKVKCFKENYKKLQLAIILIYYFYTQISTLSTSTFKSKDTVLAFEVKVEDRYQLHK